MESRSPFTVLLAAVVNAIVLLVAYLAYRLASHLSGAHPFALGVGALVVVAGGLIWLARFEAEHEAWERACESLGLEFGWSWHGFGALWQLMVGRVPEMKGVGPRVDGTLKGLPVEIYGRLGSFRTNTRRRTAVEVDFSEVLPDDLALHGESALLGGRGGVQRLQTIEVGEPDIDEHFRIRSERADVARRFLARPAVVEALVGLVGSERAVRLERGELHVERYGSIERVETARRLVEEAVDGADVLRGEWRAVVGERPAQSR
ncbi:MAG: hypothetical protein ABEL76_10690 [Bradymonadaceae bacterium]